MKVTSTLADGASNQRNCTKISKSDLKERKVLFAKDLFKKLKQLFVQVEVVDQIAEPVFIEKSVDNNQLQIIANDNAVVEATILGGVINRESCSAYINYQLNIQQMNFFTYLRRAIMSSEESLNGKFLKQFMNFLSVIVGTILNKNTPIGSINQDFDISSNFISSKLFNIKISNPKVMFSWVNVMFLTLFTAFGTLIPSTSVAVSTDLSVKKTISTQSPAIGQDVIYTIKVKNDGVVKATGVELTDILPVGVTLKTVSVGGVGFTSNSTTAGVTTVVWNVGEVGASPTELTMTIVATVAKRGLWFNTAEITKEIETDIDSSPNNHDINEDDQDAVCFSVEDYFYKGDEFITVLPAGYTNVIWTKKVGTGTAVAVTSTTPGVVLLNDGSGNIKITDITAYTEFAFSANNKNCPITGCCPIKFIYGPTGSIGDFVFTDNNKDGIQNTGDTPLSGIKIVLYKSDGITKSDSATTDVNGKYLFDSLQTNNYKVKFILPLGSVFSPTGAGIPTTDSDAGTDGFSPIISINVEGTGKTKDNPDIDAGIIGNLGSIGDFVFRDDNSNGVQDAGEPGIAGVKVNLYKGITLQSTLTTDVNGIYTFGGLTSGAYQIEVVAPLQSKFTKANQGSDSKKDSDVGITGKSQTINIDVTKLATDTLRNNPQIDAGIIPLGSIGDYVFNDNNGNGVQDATGDTKLVGLKVILTDVNGIIITSTTTDSDGKYEFIVPSGTYFVIFDKPTGSTFSPTGAGTISTDSDADATGKSGKITIDASKQVGDPARNNKDIDAGLIPNKGTIGDFVFIDSNGNNKQNAGEPGLSNVTVELYDGTGTTKLQTKVTDINGVYLFTGLESGNYKVKFLLSSGKTFVTPNVGTSAEDSDAGAGGFSGVINIDVTKPLGDIGRNNLTIDAGVKSDCNINGGTLTTTMPNSCLPTGGSVVLSATTGTSPTVPTGYSVKYVLTKGTDLIIQQIANMPTFTVTSTGEYRIHTLVYDGNSANGNYLDLSTIVLGTTKGSDVISNIAQKNICAVLDATGIKFNVNANPDAPVFAGATICAGSKVILGDKGPILSGISYAWFTSPTATMPFATTQSIEVSPVITTSYYVETTLAVSGSCASKRGSVTVMVNPKPENPITKSSIANNCTKNLQTVDLADALTAISSGSTIEWHVANDVASAIIMNATTMGAGTYYVFAKSSAGCYSGGVSVTANINSCTCANPPTVNVLAIAPICGNTITPVQLQVIIGGGASSGIWTSNGTGTFDNATSLMAKYTPSAADVTKSSVEFTFTTNDPDGADPKCIAALAKTTLVFKAKPIAPENLRCNQLICLGDSNQLFSVSQGNIVKWYSTATSTTPLGTVNNSEGFVVSPTVEGTYTYYAEATTPDGCVSERSSISFAVKKCLTDLTVIKKIYTPDGITTPDYLLGQTATYSIEAQNIGIANATDVKVDDILPVGAKYVSSTPTGEYNSITGVWTIGSLTKGSTKTLLIQVILNKIGIVVNTAEISGTNEDLTKKDDNKTVESLGTNAYPTNKDNNKSTVTIKVVDIADLSLIKTVSKTIANIGDEVEYTITVLNSGPNTATNVEVKDKLPVGLTYVSSSTLTESAGTLTGIVASIAKGATAVFTFKAKVNKEGKIINLAEVTKSDQKDPDSTPGNASIKHEDDDDSIEINSTSSCNIEKPTIACGCTLKTVCLGGEVTLTASGCVGSAEYVWSNGASTSSITVSPKTNQTYVVYCKKDNCKSESSNAVEIKVIVVDSPLLSASPSKICAGESTTLTASGCSGVVEWQTSPKQTGPQIIVKPTVSETYKAVCKEYDCVSSLASVDVIVVPKPNPPLLVCQKGEICPSETISITAMNCNGQVKWSTGQETTTITVFPISTTSYTATCSMNGCTSGNSEPFILTVKPIAIPTIKATNLITCTGGSATLTAEGCTGKVTWYFDGKILTGATIITKPTTTTTYYATCSSIVCSSDKSLPVTIQIGNPVPPIVSSGTSTICAASTVKLVATGCETGTVTWSDGQKGAIVMVKPLLSTSYTATCSIGTCVSDNSNKRNITVTDFARPTITADKLAICAGNSVTLTSNGCNGTVKWSDGVIGSPRTVIPTADVKYTATCESSTCKSDISNELAIKVSTIGNAPIISCATTTTVCASESVTLSALGCASGTVLWSNGKTGTSIIEVVKATTTYTAVCKQGITCNSPESNKFTVTVTVPSVPTISCTTSIICSGSTITLYATGCEGTVKWSDGQSGAIITSIPTKTTDYSATCTIGTCTSSPSSIATVNVGNPPAPSITCNSPLSICQGVQITLSATNCMGTVVWNDGQVGNVITAKPNVTTKYTAICKLDKCESIKSNEITITVGAGVTTPKTKNLNNICPFLTVDLASGITSSLSAGGIIEYHTGVLPSSPLVSNPNAVSTGTYYVFEKTGTGCYSSPGVINTYINPDCTPKDCAKTPATVNAGADVTICAEKIHKLSGSFGGAATSITWKTTGTGSFDNSLLPTATYRSSLADVLAGTVKLIICTNDPDGIGPCIAKADTMILTMNGVKFKPIVAISGNLNACGTDSVTLTATAGYDYMWFKVGASTSPFARTRSIVVKSSGSYFFKLVDSNKCCSIESDTVTVNLLTTPNAPTANSVKIDRGTTIDLNKLVISSLPAGTTLVFKTGVSSGSTTISNPSSVGAGIYYAFYKSAQGCFSLSTKITVENKDGNIFSLSDADIQVTIKTNKAIYAKGDTVIITITVKNLGTGTAKGIIVSSIVPGTLTYVSQTGGLVKLGSILTGMLDSLVKDGVKVYTYASVLNTNSETVVAAGGTTTTKDPNLNNNNGTDSGTATINKGEIDITVADVAVVITSDKAVAKVGDNINFLLSLTNNGSATAKQVVVTNSIPVGITFVSSSTGQILTGGAITISLDSLKKGEVKTYAYVATMNVKTSVTNAVMVTSLKDNVAPNDASFVIINGDTTGTTKDEAELALLLTADKQLIGKDDVVTFTIKVTNNGPKVATNIVVDNILPKYLTFQSGDPSQKGDTLRVETVSIPVGGTVTYSYKAKVDKDTIIYNTAKIMKTSPTDPILTNNVSTVVLVPASDTTYSDLAVVITANTATHKVGDNVTYTVTLTNNGAGFAKNIQLCNPLPNGLTYVSGTGVIKAGDSVTVNVDTISKGKTLTFTYVTKATKAGTIANTVRICNSSKVDLITPNNTSTSLITVTKDSIPTTPICNINLSMAILDTAKVSDGVYNVTFRLIAKNVCKDTLRNVTLTNNLAKVFKIPVTFEIVEKSITGIGTNLIINDLFSRTDSNLVNVGSYILPNVSDTIKYVVKITLNGNKGPFFSEATIKGKTINEDLTAKAKAVLRFDLPNTRIGLAKEVLTTALKNDSTTYWTIPYRIRVVNMGVNAITKLSVKDSLDAVFTVKGAKIIGIPTIIVTPRLTVNKKFTGSGLFTDLLIPDSSSLARGDTAIIDLTVRVNTETSTDIENIYNNVAIGTATGTDKLTYRDVSTNGNNPDANGDNDPSNDNVATPVRLSNDGGTKEVSIGIALAAVTTDSTLLADSTCNVILTMTAKNYGTNNLRKVRLCNNIGNTIGKQAESWKLVGTPRVIRGNATINLSFNGATDSTITQSDNTFLAVGDSIVIVYMVSIKLPMKDTIYTQAIAKAVSALDSTKSTFDISTNGLKPDLNGDGKPNEATPTPIICKSIILSALFIPQGFSPNGDGINDGFVIRGIKSDEKIELLVFNRWGGVVYANQDYKNDWKGEANVGVKMVGDSQGLPDGTYYYIVTRFKITGEKVDAVPSVRYMTILR